MLKGVVWRGEPTGWDIRPEKTDWAHHMINFGKLGDRYWASITSTLGSALLEVDLDDERTEDFEVIALSAKRSPAMVRARVLEGTDLANWEFGTNFQPRQARYAIINLAGAFLLPLVAYAVVRQLATHGEVGYESQA